MYYRTRIPSRARSLRIEARGIFPGAEVVRGHNWRWGNQDGKWLWLESLSGHPTCNKRTFCLSISYSVLTHLMSNDVLWSFHLFYASRGGSSSMGGMLRCVNSAQTLCRHKALKTAASNRQILCYGDL